VISGISLQIVESLDMQFLRCKFSIVSKKVGANGVMVSGKYNPLSDANPCITASLKEKLVGRYGLNYSISLFMGSK
jgi:hypothetical protein